VCELLKANQINCEVRGEGLFGLQGEIPFGEASEPYVWLVDTDKLKSAKALISQYQQSEHQQEWRCQTCGELNEGQFAVCWQCESTAPNQAAFE
jgi:hypothetical protein